MEKTIVVAVLGLAIVSAIIISVYGALAWYSGYQWINRVVERKAIPVSVELPYVSTAQNFTWTFKRGWRWTLENKYCRGFRGIEIELSEGFKEKILGIAENDEDVQNLLNEGYNVSDIRIIHVKLVVQENGQITMEANRALLILTKNGSGRAFVEIDLKTEKVTKITIISIKIIDKSTST